MIELIRKLFRKPTQQELAKKAFKNKPKRGFEQRITYN